MPIDSSEQGVPMSLGRRSGLNRQRPGPQARLYVTLERAEPEPDKEKQRVSIPEQ
jgi:hypothetical protein